MLRSTGRDWRKEPFRWYQRAYVQECSPSKSQWNQWTMKSWRPGASFRARLLWHAKISQALLSLSRNSHFFSVFAWGLTKDISSTFTEARGRKSPVVDVITSTQRDRGPGLAGYGELSPGGVLEDKKEYSSGGGLRSKQSESWVRVMAKQLSSKSGCRFCHLDQDTSEKGRWS